MYRIDDEVLLLSRGGRVAAVGEWRREQARRLEERAQHEIALRERGPRVSLLARVGARLAAGGRARWTARGAGELTGAAGRAPSRRS